MRSLKFLATIHFGTRLALSFIQTHTHTYTHMHSRAHTHTHTHTHTHIADTNTLFRKFQIVEKQSTHKLFRTVTINVLESIDLRTKASEQYWRSTHLFSKNLENKSLDRQYLSVYFWISQYSSTHRQLIDSLRHTWSSIYWEVLLSIYWRSVLAPLRFYLPLICSLCYHPSRMKVCAKRNSEM